MDGCIETSQIVCTCDKNILYAPIPQTIQYGWPRTLRSHSRRPTCPEHLCGRSDQGRWQCTLLSLRSALRCGHGSGSHPEKPRHRSIPEAATAILSPQAGDRLTVSRLMLVWFFFRSCGSNSPFRSRGTETSTSPKLVRRFLLYGLFLPDFDSFGTYLFLHPDASILHLSEGLHNYWDGLA